MLPLNVIEESEAGIKLQNGSAHKVGASYSGLYEEGEVETYQRPTL